MLTRLTLTLFLLLLWGLGYKTLSQPPKYSFQHINKTNGLSNNSVNCVLKDSKGFIWFGTASGLNRFDGYDIKIFVHNPLDSNSIRDNFISNLAEDINGKIWINAGYGYDIYDPQTETFCHNPLTQLKSLSISNLSIASVKKDNKGNLSFVTYQHGLYKYYVSENKSISFSHVPNNPFSIYSDTIEDIADDPSGNIWIIYKSGVFDFVDGKSAKVLYRNDFLKNKYSDREVKYRLFVDSDKDLWISIYNLDFGIYLFHSKSKQLQHFDNKSQPWKLNTNGARIVTQDLTGKIWIATDPGGINILNKATNEINYLLHRPDDQFSISQNSITHLYMDNTGIIWASTFKQGVSFLNHNASKFALYKNLLGDPNSLPFSDVDCFLEDSLGNIWIGTNGGGLLYWNRKLNTFTQYKNIPGDRNSLSANVIISLYLDPQQILWIGTYMGGLNRFDGKKFTRYMHNSSDTTSIADDRIWSIFRDSHKNLWIGTLGMGLERFDPNKSTFYHYPAKTKNSVFDSFILNITEDKDGNVWFGTSYGISILNLKTDSFSIFLPNFKDAGSNNITGLLTSQNGDIWIGTRNGLARYDHKYKYAEILYEKDGLPSSLISSLKEAPNGDIWVATANGISCIHYTIDAQKHYTYQFRNFDESDGLQGKEFNTNASYRTRKGELIFGGSNGFNIFSAKSIEKNQKVPEIVFTDFEIFYKRVGVGEKIHNRTLLNKSITYTQEVTLKHNENIFSIQFSALNYLNPEKNKYRYMLDGFNSDWVITDAKNRKVTYTNLNPGTYVFHVTGSNNDGIWNKEGISLTIHILPPWWKTWWFISILGILIVTVIVSVFQFRVSIYKRMTSELRRLVRERTLELEKKNFQLMEGTVRMEEQSEEIQSHAENLKDANDLLIEKNQLIQEQSQLLEESNQQLVISNATKDRFFSIIAHDLRNPFHVVTGFSDIIINELKELTLEQLEQYVKIINETSKNGNNLLDNLLQWSRSQTGVINYVPEKLSLFSVAQETVTLLKGDAERKQITLITTINPSMDVRADENMLKTILRNLTSNAIKFTPIGGNVQIEATVKNQTVEICVKDSGIGISEENIKILFHIDSNISTKGTSNESGTGLGLILCKEFVQRHGGSIWVESELGKGSKFKFSIPIG